MVMEVHLHSFHCAHGDQLLDGGFLLVAHPLFFSVMSTPLGGEEVGKSSQPLSFSLDLALVLTKLPQSDNICHDTCVTNCLNCPSYCPIHLESLS